jgi:hypothetical protein
VRWPMGGQVVPACAEVLPLFLVPPTKKGKRGAKALRKTGAARALCSASGRGCERKSAKAMADQDLVNVGAGTFDELLLVLRQSFKDDRYSPWTGMEEIQWRIMLEQFIVSGAVVKDDIIDIDSD